MSSSEPGSRFARRMRDATCLHMRTEALSTREAARLLLWQELAERSGKPCAQDFWPPPLRNLARVVVVPTAWRLSMTDLLHELPTPASLPVRGSVTPSGLTCEVREQQTVPSVHSGPDTVGHRLWWCRCHSVDSESVGDRVGEGREDTSDDSKPVLDWRLPRPGRTAGTARGGTRSVRGPVGDVT